MDTARDVTDFSTRYFNQFQRNAFTQSSRKTDGKTGKGKIIIDALQFSYAVPYGWMHGPSWRGTAAETRGTC